MGNVSATDASKGYSTQNSNFSHANAWSGWFVLEPQDLPEDPQMKIMAKTMEAHCGQVQWCSHYYRGEGHKLFRGLLGDL